MKVKEIKEKQKWEDFLEKCKEKTFLDSWNWGEFQEKLGHQVWKLGAYDQEKLVGVALIIEVDARRGTFLSVPHGPVIKHFDKKYILKSFLEKLKEIGKKEGASFLRFEPIWERNKENEGLFKELGFRKAPIHIHPELTLELNLKKPERAVLKGMRKNTRYSIRKAKREGVKVFKSKKIEDVDKFYELYKKVVNRKEFVPFSLEYIKKEFETFLKDNQILIFFAEYKREILSSAIVVYWQNKAFYHHGASNLKHSKIPISYPVQWEAIKEARQRECISYNFWGVAPEDASENHPWHGLTLFKTGFGGERKKYVKTQDYPLSLKYWPIFVFEKMRKRKRGL